MRSRAGDFTGTRMPVVHTGARQVREKVAEADMPVEASVPVIVWAPIDPARFTDGMCPLQVNVPPDVVVAEQMAMGLADATPFP